jgi:S1-C subfamily serine protease
MLLTEAALGPREGAQGQELQVVVESVAAGGHAQAAGVKPGDVILATTARALTVL